MTQQEWFCELYKDDPDLLKGYMTVESCANGRNATAFIGDAFLTKADGSFEKDLLLPSVLSRFLKDGYVEQVPGTLNRYKRAF